MKTKSEILNLKGANTMLKKIKKTAFILSTLMFSEASANLVSDILPSPQTQDIGWICGQGNIGRHGILLDIVGKRKKDSKVFTGGAPRTPYHDYKQYPIEINERISLSVQRADRDNLPPSEEIHYIWQINRLDRFSTAFSVSLHHGNKLEASMKYPGEYTVNVVAFVRNKNDQLLNYKSYKKSL